MNQPEIIYKVTTESDSYGSECTTDQAKTFAHYIAEKIYEYADDQGYDLFVEIVYHSLNINPYFDDEEAAAWDDINTYIEDNWVDWLSDCFMETEYA